MKHSPCISPPCATMPCTRLLVISVIYAGLICLGQESLSVLPISNLHCSCHGPNICSDFCSSWSVCEGSPSSRACLLILPKFLLSLSCWIVCASLVHYVASGGSKQGMCVLFVCITTPKTHALDAYPSESSASLEPDTCVGQTQTLVL